MHIIAYKTKSEEDYLSSFAELIRSGYKPFLTFGYKEGTYLAGRIGSVMFTDGTQLTGADTIFVDSISEYLMKDET